MAPQFLPGRTAPVTLTVSVKFAGKDPQKVQRKGCLGDWFRGRLGTGEFFHL